MDKVYVGAGLEDGNVIVPDGTNAKSFEITATTGYVSALGQQDGPGAIAPKGYTILDDANALTKDKTIKIGTIVPHSKNTAGGASALAVTTDIYFVTPASWIKTSGTATNPYIINPDGATTADITLQPVLGKDAAVTFAGANAAAGTLWAVADDAAIVTVTPDNANDKWTVKATDANQAGKTATITIHAHTAASADIVLGTVVVKVQATTTVIGDMTVTATSAKAKDNVITVTTDKTPTDYADIEISMAATVDGTKQTFKVTYDEIRASFVPANLVWKDAKGKKIATGAAGYITFSKGLGDSDIRITPVNGSVDEALTTVISFEFNDKTSKEEKHFKGSVDVTLTVVPGLTLTNANVNFTPVNNMGVNAMEFKSASDGLRSVSASLNVANAPETYDESTLYYTWAVIDDKFMPAAATIAGTTYAAGTTETTVKGLAGGATYTANKAAFDAALTGLNGKDVVEIDGEKFGVGLNSIKLGVNKAEVSGLYGVAVSIWYSEKSNAKGNPAAATGIFYVKTVANNDTLTVTLNSSKIGTDGVVVSTTAMQKFPGAVTVKGGSGADVSEEATYYLIESGAFDTQIRADQTLAQISAALDENGAQATLNKGELKVNGNVAAGRAYRVIAKYANTYGASADSFIIRSKKGISVESVTVDLETVTLKNVNDTGRVYAVIGPVKYLSNGFTKDTEASAEIDVVTVTSSNEKVAIAAVTGRKTLVKNDVDTNNPMDNTRRITVTAMGPGEATITVTTVDQKKTATFKVVVDESSVEPTPEPEEHKAGDVFSADGYTVEVLADLTVAIQDAPVVGKNVTIPEKVDGLTVSAIDEKAFKGSSAKKVYVEGAVAELGKAAFKKSKVKKVFFYQPAALTTVDKNAFAKTNAKVVAVGGSFSKDVAKQLEKAGAKSVKNNGTAK